MSPLLDSGTQVAPERAASPAAPAETQSGFSLVETLVATSILLTAVIALAQLSVVSAAAVGRAAAHTLATAAARDKIEELQGTPWAALPLSPSSTLEGDVAGFSDALTGPGRPPLQRRWSVVPLAAAPDRLLVVEVAVLGAGGQVEARLLTLKRREGA